MRAPEEGVPALVTYPAYFSLSLTNRQEVVGGPSCSAGGLLPWWLVLKGTTPG
jgi:hypothetical protein